MTSTAAPPPVQPVASPTLRGLIQDEWKGFGSATSRDWDWYLLNSGLGRTLGAFRHFDGQAIDDKLWANVGAHDAQWPGGFHPGHEDREAVAFHFRGAFESMKTAMDFGLVKQEILKGLYYKALASQMRKLHETVQWEQVEGRQRHMDYVSDALFGGAGDARPKESLDEYYTCLRTAGDEAIDCLEREPEVFAARVYWTAFQK